MHGWPESWYTWKEQLVALGAQGYHAVAPDMRGYGGSAAPTDKREYTISHIRDDMLATVRHLGYNAAFLVGHDWGGFMAWWLGLQCPETFVAVAVLSVPFAGHPKKPMLTVMREAYGHEEDKSSSFFYQLHHNLPEAPRQYARDTRLSLRRLYGGSMNPQAKDSDPALVTSHLLYPDGGKESVGLPPRLTTPRHLPAWLPASDFEYFVQEYSWPSSGAAPWAGGMCWYQTGDLNWEETKAWEGKKMQQPVLFLGGGKDPIITQMFGGVDKATAHMKGQCEALAGVVIYPHAGHWIQMEESKGVTQALLGFLRVQEASRVMPAAHKCRL